MPERELDDIARKMPSERGSSVDTGGGTGGADEDGPREEYSEEAAEAISELTATDESRRLDASYSLDLDDEGLLDEVERGLQESLDDDDPEVRAAAARSLGEIGSEDSVDGLRDASKDKVRAVSNAATEALRQVVNSEGRRLSGEGGSEVPEDDTSSERTSPDASVSVEASSQREEVSGVGEGEEPEASADTAGVSTEEHAEPETSTEEAVKGPVHGEAEGEGEADQPGSDDRSETEAGEVSEGRAGDGEKTVSEVGEGLGIPDTVVLRLVESGNDGVSGLVESSIRSAVESYPDVAEQEVGRYSELLSDDRAVVRRYASRFISAVSEVDASLLEEEVDGVVDSLEDGDEVVREHAEDALKNIAQESPETLTDIVVEAKKSD